MTETEELTRLRRAVRWALYGCLLALAAALAVGVGNVAYTNNVDRDRAAATAKAEAERAASAEQTKATFCQAAIAQRNAFDQSTTQVGRDAYNGWQELITTLGC